jgi:hypothetical protein
MLSVVDRAEGVCILEGDKVIQIMGSLNYIP